MLGTDHCYFLCTYIYTAQLADLLLTTRYVQLAGGVDQGHGVLRVQANQGLVEKHLEFYYLLIRNITQFFLEYKGKMRKQAGAELGQAQYKIDYLSKLMSSASSNASIGVKILFHRGVLPLRSSSFLVVFH